MSIFTFKAYNPGKGTFIDIKTDNSKSNASPEAQQVPVASSSGVRNASAGLLALSNYIRTTHDPFSPSVIHSIQSFSSLPDNRNPQLPFLSRPPARVGLFLFEKPSYSLQPISTLSLDHPSIPTPNFTRPVRPIRSPLGPLLDQQHRQHFTPLPTRRSPSLSSALSSPDRRWSPGPSRLSWDRSMSLWIVFLV